MTVRTSASVPVRTFVDSNILIYARDNGAGWKQQMAQKALDELWLHECGTLSVQVLQEFYSVVTRKMKAQISKELARETVNDYMVWCGVTTGSEVKAAFQIEDKTNMSFWDALIVACAQRNGATRILSENMQHGQIIDGIEIVNPFHGL